MAKKSSKKERRPKAPAFEMPEMDPRVKRDIIAVICALLGFISILAFFSAAGPVGSFIASSLEALLGITRFLFPPFMLLLAAKIAFPDRFVLGGKTVFGAVMLFLSFNALASVIRWKTWDAMLFDDHLRAAGGYVGLLGGSLVVLMGFWATLLVLLAVMAAAVTLTFNVSLRETFGAAARALAESLRRKNDAADATVDAEPYEPSDDAMQEKLPNFTKKNAEIADMDDDSPTAADAQALAMTMAVKKRRAKKVAIPFDLLEQRNSKPTPGDIQGKQNAIQKTLKNFGIEVEMGDVSVGPTVTQFAMKPADGVKLTRITSLSNDLALALAAHPIRIEAPIPGKSLVGIEVPNQSVAMVSMREILESKEFAQRKSNLSICLGKDVAGKPWIADLGRMPHMLVAGATGSGKTVCLNTIILSLLFQNGPDELKLMLIDPKRVELPVYNGIPHLLTPAITEVPKIINALKWAIGEMDRRFDLLSKSGKRDIGSYNEVAEEKMPYLVIVIDELADLMVASAAEVETAIIRLAQLARAVGIHLVVATQRPSVDVITGLIKANITARCAFSVASSTDSRTILDQPGAEKLVGRGDSLFLTAELSMPKRIQGCYVGDMEIRKVVDFLMEQLEEPVEYVEGVTEKVRSGMGNDFGYGDDGDDELFEEARDCVVKAGKASASYLQRRLKIGYARAARLLDLLEERGIIGPGDGAKPRQILVAPVGDVDGQHFTDDDEM